MDQQMKSTFIKENTSQKPGQRAMKPTYRAATNTNLLNATCRADGGPESTDKPHVNNGELLNKTIKPPAVRSLVSMCATITSDRADLVSVDRLISLLDKTVSQMIPEMVLPEMKWMLLDTVLFVAASPERFPFKVRQGILEAALACTVFDAQRAMLQKRLFEAWDKECWECNLQTDDMTWKTNHRGQPQQDFNQVFSTERLQGVIRAYTTPAFPNYVIDSKGNKHDKDSDQDSQKLPDRRDTDFMTWWKKHALEARKAFMKQNEHIWRNWDHGFETDDISLGMTETVL